MLKITLGVPGQRDAILVSGNLLEITANFGQAIADLYAQMKRDIPLNAELFRASMVRLVADPGTPVWDGKLDAAFAMTTVVPGKEGDGC